MHGQARLNMRRWPSGEECFNCECKRGRWEMDLSFPTSLYRNEVVTWVVVCSKYFWTHAFDVHEVSQSKLKFNMLFSVVNCSIYTSFRTIVIISLTSKHSVWYAQLDWWVLYNIKAQSIPCLILPTNSAVIYLNKSFIGWTTKIAIW
jgi:hypothetical protein